MVLLVGGGTGSLPVLAEEEIILEEGPATEEELLLEGGADEGDEILMEQADAPGQEMEEVLLLDESDRPDKPESALMQANNPRFAIDDLRLEYGHHLRDASAADRELYGKLAVSLNWRPQASWELQLSGRMDGYDQDGRRDWSELRADYGDSFLAYRGAGIRLTAGAQTVIWGRMDEVPLSDRVSTADLTRFVMDDLEDRRRSAPLVRAEVNIGEGRLDLVWLYEFRAAELPDRDSSWYPIDQTRGRILGVDPVDVNPLLVQSATIIEDEPEGDGGFGARYTASPFFGDIGITVAHTRRSTPYYRILGTALKTEYPRSWAFGADTAVDAMGVTWRAEVVYSSDNPVTRRDLSYTTTEAVEWGLGAEMYPGDGDARVNLQLMGSNLVDPGAIFDRTEAYNLNGTIDIPFDRERWRASLDFFVGLDKKDIYLNPEIAFLAWEPHEIYLALHYFDGDAQTLGGFHENDSRINLGWRAQF